MPSVATKKKWPVMTECEVKVRGRWLPCTIFEALTEREQIMRCNIAMTRCRRSWNPAMESEPTSNTCKNMLAGVSCWGVQWGGIGIIRWRWTRAKYGRGSCHR
jgi:hypothetical protein